jgi:hypothetical protein
MGKDSERTSALAPAPSGDRAWDLPVVGLLIRTQAVSGINRYAGLHLLASYATLDSHGMILFMPDQTAQYLSKCPLFLH